MSTNPYFNKTAFVTEQGLIQDLIDEAIKIHGLDTTYIVRADVDLDQLFGEDELAKFQDFGGIEMYVKSSTSFAGQSEFITKFGLHIEDQIVFVVSKRRWFQESIIPGRPREGDIIWLQMDNNKYLFDIKFVEDKEQLFQLGKLYTYELRCELMTYSHERIETGNTIIDSASRAQTFTIALQLVNPIGTFVAYEQVYQGDVLTPTATGTVSSYTGNSSVGTLLVHNITGTFSVDGSVVVGITSGASATLDVTPETRVSEIDAAADNVLISNEAENVIVIRGTNPIREPITVDTTEIGFPSSNASWIDSGWVE